MRNNKIKKLIRKLESRNELRRIKEYSKFKVSSKSSLTEKEFFELAKETNKTLKELSSISREAGSRHSLTNVAKMYDKLKTLVLYNLYGAGRLPWKYDMHSTNLIVEAYNEVDSAVQKMVK